MSIRNIYVSLVIGLVLITASIWWWSVPSTGVLDLAGRPVDPLNGDVPVVLIFVRADCPTSNRYAPEMQRIYERFSPEGVSFWLVYVDPAQRPDVIERHLAQYSLELNVSRDLEPELVARVGAKVTPEAAVFLADGQLVYKGRIDNRYTDFGKARAQATRRELVTVLEAALAGGPMTPSRTPAVGCFIADLEPTG